MLKWCIHDYIRNEDDFYSFLNDIERELYCVSYSDFIGFLEEKING